MTRPAPTNAVRIGHLTAESWQVFVDNVWVGNVSLLPNHLTRFGGEYEAIRLTDRKIIGYFDSVASAAAAIQKSLDAT